MINIIFCKIYDENYTPNNESLCFRAEEHENETPEIVKKRIDDLFKDVRKQKTTVVDKTDEITLDANSVYYLVGELQAYSLVNAPRDSVADAFETFIDHALKGGQGQFFTPRNVVKMMVDILQPTTNDYVIDPACGSGGFLEEVLRDNLKYHPLEEEDA